ncbi:MAG TPA: zf-HC2 domain-containing protein [Gemmatimonadales bacterium]
MNDQWTTRLSEYIDGELDSTERAALEAHLATCGQCYATLGELRQVVARAKSLEDSPPTTDLWTGIAREIRREQAPARRDRLVRRRFSLTVGQLLAASIALVLLSGGSAWLALRQGPTDTPEPIAVTRPAGTRVASWTGSTDIAVGELEAALTQNEKRLDSTTVRIVRKNLAIINRAIAEARIALRNDPGNAYLNLHLADTMRRKVELLRRVNDIAAARS